MKEKQNTIDRRNFLKTVGAAGLSSVLASTGAIAGPNQSNAEDKPKYPQVPKRKLGKTGVEVPSLSLGTNRLLDNQILLRVALQRGISYWDTAHNYAGGNSELTIGKFLSRSPDVRKKLFIASKASGARTVADVEERLQTSLKRMNTEYIDLYYGVHGLSSPSQLTNELKEWVRSAKKRGLIRFFGFSTHKNIDQNLVAAAKLGWIDAIMTSYNFRLMQDAKIQAAIETCHKAGIGLIAMKTVALDVRQRGRIEKGEKIETEEDKKLLSHFLEQGLTVEHAKIKFVLEDKRFSSACVGMNNVTNLKSNVEAALDKTKLTQADREALAEYARATCSSYCTACAHICNSALPDAPYVSNIMRYLMYHNSYGEQAEAKRLFAQIPAGVRNKLLDMDYTLAEARCPQHLPIRELITEAVSVLT
ncbi:MAG: aldo/keto reductase [Planctomycetes bacterium]|nr:aldo/keto reductase [Planctomycetota bacterium]